MYAVLGKINQIKSVESDAEKAGAPLSQEQLDVVNRIIDKTTAKNKN
jgi:hypothetical protein